ncbi:ABC transporter permease subunit [Microbacterium oxydans]|nr:ABC transporter permease subunit [Microbacterium oxydans]
MLPVVALAVGPIAVFSRIIRVEVLSVLGQDFIRTARAKRLAPRRIYSRHALPNAMTATLTLTGLLLTGMVAGTVLVENVFAWPGLGTMIVQSILTKDYSVVQGIVLVYGVGGAGREPRDRRDPRAPRSSLHHQGGMMSARTAWSGIVRSPLGITALGLILLVTLGAIFAPMIWGAQAEQVDPTAITQGPSAEHLLGTDALGRDVLARVLVATRLSVVLAVVAVVIGVVAGTLLGTAPSVLPRWVGRPIVGFVNIAVAFPGLLLALFFAVIFGVGSTGAVLAIGFAMAPQFARLTQTLSAAIAGRDFISAARVAGVSRLRVLIRHILPNIGEPLIVNATVAAGSALLAFAGLSFLGLGVQVPEYDWGRLLGEGLNRIYLNPAAALGPGRGRGDRRPRLQPPRRDGGCSPGRTVGSAPPSPSHRRALRSDRTRCQQARAGRR